MKRYVVTRVLDGPCEVKPIETRPNGAVICVDKLLGGCEQSDPTFWTYPVFRPESDGSMPQAIAGTVEEARDVADRLGNANV